MKPDNKRPIALEDLLRLKRTERPPPEFWSQFDRELRAKQLAALVAKRPWWERLPGGFAGLSRYRLPLGAAAILALTFVSLRDRPEMPAEVNSEVSVLQTRAPALSIPASVATVAQQTANVEDAPLADPPAAVGANKTLTTPLLAELTPAGSSETQWVDAVVPPVSPDLNESLPVAQHVVGAATTVAGAFAASGLLAHAFESRAVASSPAIDPLKRMTPPGERMRSRLLTAMVSMSSAEAPVRTSERQARRISQDELYDQISRFDARGAGVNMKF